MRTTLTLDPDNAARLERLRKERDASLKDVINDALRRGLNAMEEQAKTQSWAPPPPLDLGPALFNDPKELLRLLDEEDDLRKLGLPK
ncbi:MAG: ribbon-helix-helix protein, CopG family [Proteobacteria bacterium]|nr:ribbon-helix-helix protein, CopG family [Pseudomonadota bacterium]